MYLEELLEDSNFKTHEEVLERYPVQGESRYAVEPLLGKVRNIFRDLGYSKIRRIRIHESGEDVIILFVSPERGKEAIIGYVNPSKNVIVMSKPTREMMWLTFEFDKLQAKAKEQ